MAHCALPTEKILRWQDLELGVLIHYCMEIYRPELTGDWYKTERVREAIPPASIHPKKLEPAQWVRAAHAMGAKYAILVAKHCTGFALWDTKVNDFSIAHTDWRGGGGDVCREFVEACRHYGLLPGFYYSTGCNGYYDINDNRKMDYRSPKYQAYVKNVEAQVRELWTEYGELFEIWFDGGVIPPADGGPDLIPLLKRYQPNAVCFQGPRDWPHDLRWVGNEDGLAPADCWATTNAGEARYDGTVPNEQAGVGDPDGKYYWPAECDMPNRDHRSFGGGWGWAKGEEDHVFSPETLLDCYVRSVGRNANLLVGMAISTDGDFQDEEQFVRFGELLKKTFGTPAVSVEHPQPTESRVALASDGETPMAYCSIREDIAGGQRIRAFRVLADGREIAAGHCVGHRRILPLGGLCFKELTFVVDEAAGPWAIRDLAVYAQK